MKKQFFLLFMFFMLAAGHAFSQTVYITKTGKKYHVVTCRYLSRSSIAIPLSDALAEGYTACSICDPSVKVTSGESQNRTTSPVIVGRRQVAVQCSARTQSGSRCKRMIKSRNGMCWQHGGD